MNTYKRVLTIAGSDSGGGAGIQADIKTISALGCYAASAITAVTVQNTCGVQAVHPIPPEIIAAQIHAVVSDIGVDAIKIGMLGSPAAAQAVAQALSELKKQNKIKNVVLDPVLIATSGHTLSSEDTAQTIITHLFPLADIITPNIPEAEKLTSLGFLPQATKQIIEKLTALGAKSILLKGGHAPLNNTITDTLFHDNTYRTFTSEFYNTPNKHGTGCSLSSAIASYLALGFEMPIAVEYATAYIHHAIASAVEYKIGHGNGPIHHFFKFWE